MSYLSLYRKWRPQAFDEVISQTHVTRTLQNALSMKRIAHAYLFCGPRGTGKTTVAKLFAKALNCKQGPSPNPCNECANCQQIRDGFAMDVVEIDGASNRGIDEIRDLREKVKFAPSEGQYKVYIIDEVHMLTTEAFNALLKTLEEPPAHVIFIFATTEPHKIPATILSRCQRFDFKRIGLADLITHLRRIADAENLQVSDETLAVIARSAEGGLRDALSILDQCISFSGNSIEKSEVQSLLGMVDLEVLSRLTDACAAGDLALGLGLLDEVTNAGKDLRQVARDWTGHLRNLLLLKVAPGQNLPGLEPETEQLLARQAERFLLPTLLASIETLAQVEGELRWSAQGKLPLELALIRLVQLAVPSQAQSPAPVPQPTPTPATAPVAAPTAAKPARASAAPQREAAARVPQPSSAATDETAPAVVPAEPFSGSLDFDGVAARWSEFLETLRQEKLTSEQAFLREGSPCALHNGSLLVGFSAAHKFHMDQMNNPARKSAVEKAMRKFFGCALRLECLPGELAAPGKQAIGDPDHEEKSTAQSVVALGQQEISAATVIDPVEPATSRARPGDEPLDVMVKRAIEIFGATVVKVE